MICRQCNQRSLFTGMDLGNLPVSNELLSSHNEISEKFEVKLMICKSCGLGQVSKDLSPHRLFDYYTFRTSVSTTFAKHAIQFANDCIKNLNFKKGQWVLEIASNDGYLLKNFLHNGIETLGVEPAKNITLYATCDQVPTYNAYFSSKVAKQILDLKGSPRLIVANNVLAHVPDIRDFMQGLSLLANNETLISIENPSIINILKDQQFDTVYHEHYSYLSCNSVSRLAEDFGLCLNKVETLTTHGGSNRYWLSKNKKVESNVTNKISEEINEGLFDENAWKLAFLEIKKTVSSFYQKIKNLNENGAKVCGFTASAKSTVLLNFAQIESDWIKSIADDAIEKQNKFLPGLKIPIVSLDKMLDQKPTDIVVFSWNIFSDIKKKITDPTIDVWIWNQEKID